MNTSQSRFSILLANDDPDDRLLLQAAIEENGFHNPLVFLENGKDLMDYLFFKGRHTTTERLTLPGLILLDLNMPIMDGRDVLRQIKAMPDFRHIPVIILTTSSSKLDAQICYELGANSYITKPTSFEALVQTIKTLYEYWFIGLYGSVYPL